MSRPLVTLLPVLLTVAACEAPPPPTPQARADAATLAACREHADAVYDRTHRDSIYAINNRNTPYSANDAYSVVDHGLPQSLDLGLDGIELVEACHLGGRGSREAGDTGEAAAGGGIGR